MLCLWAAPDAWAADVEFRIEVRDLGRALNEFALQSGMEILFAEDEVRGKTTVGVVGRHTPIEALSRLLRDTGLRYRFTARDTVLVDLEPAGGQGSAATASDGQPRSLIARVARAVAATLTGPRTQPAAGDTVGGSARPAEEVIVYGIRASLQQSLERKKAADHFVDIITAEDIGAFPTQNLAEALQRVSGVAIDRKEGEGAFVSVRGLGPQFAQTTINGRVSASNVDPGQHDGRGQTNSGSRVVGFHAFQSGLVHAVEVHKTPRADHVEGGLGGFIDVQTRRPLDLGRRRLALAVDATVNELAADTAPGAFALFSSVPNDAVGIMVSAQWDNRLVRSDSLHHYSYVPEIRTYTVNGQEISGYHPRQVLGELHVSDRDRLNVSGSLQWMPSERLDATFDLLLTDVASGERDYWRDFRIQNALASNITAATVTDDNGTPVFTSITSSGAALFLQQAAERVNTNVLTWGSNVTLQATARLAFDVDVSLSTMDSPSENQEYLVRNTATQVSYRKYGPSGAPSITSASPLNDPHFYRVVKHSHQRHHAADRVAQIRTDATLEIGSDWWRAFKLGVRWSRQERNDRHRYLTSQAFVDQPITDFGGDDPFPEESSFLAGLGNEFPSNIVNPDLDSMQRTFVTRADEIRRGPCFTTGTECSLAGFRNQPFNEDINNEEDSAAIYALAFFGGEVAGTPYSGNLGARYVTTGSRTVGFFLEPVAFDTSDPSRPVLVLSEPRLNSVSHRYAKALPSLNLRLDPHDTVVVRASVARVLSRPSYLDLNPRQTGGAISRQLFSGNGELDPTTGWQVDLGLEWYFADYSLASVGVFDKDITGIVQLTIDQVGFPNVIDPDTNEPVVLTWRRPENSGNSDLKGLEVTLQTTFAALPHPFNDLGLNANYTYVASSSDFRSETTRAAYSIPGLSENTVNITAFYELGHLSARVSYNYRDEFLDTIADAGGHPYFVDAYEQFDASMAYAPSDRLSLSLEAINLTDENVYYYSRLGTGTQRHFASAINAGRRFQFGIRLNR
ncbi:MAG: TonB-dependent receptor [Gammaproteobacteria bacterium]|nr:TonB-dependent receptor [Gammaproteobacteria bacterium]